MWTSEDEYFWQWYQCSVIDMEEEGRIKNFEPNPDGEEERPCA